MGFHKELYLGPYLLVSLLTKTETKTLRTCTNKECKNRKQKPPARLAGNFCNECGSPIADVTFSKQVKRRIIDVIGEDMKKAGVWELASGGDYIFDDFSIIYPIDLSKLRFNQLNFLNEEEIINELNYDKEDLMQRFAGACSQIIKLLNDNGYTYEIKFALIQYYQ